MKEIIVYSPYDCLIKSKEGQITLNKNEHLVLSSNDPFNVYPVGKSSRYAFVVDLNQQVDSPFYRVLSDNNSLKIFLLDGLLSENCQVFSFFIQGENCSVKASEKYIEFSSTKKQSKVFLPAPYKSLDCGKMQGIVYVHIFEQKQERLLAFNPKTDRIKTFIGDKITVTSSGWKVLGNDEKEYYVDKEGLKIKDECSILSKSPVFIGHNFMSLIEDKQFSKAYLHLSSSLQSRLDADALKGYFGNVSYFYFLEPKICFAISDNKNMLYHFDFQDDKICEIWD